MPHESFDVDEPQKKGVVGLHDFYLMTKCCLFQQVLFLCWVDYAPNGSTFLLGRLFHTERPLHTYQLTDVFVSGRQDLPSDARAFSG